MLLGTFAIIPKNITNLYLYIRDNVPLNSEIDTYYLASAINASVYIQKRDLTPATIKGICQQSYDESGHDEVSTLCLMITRLMVRYLTCDSRTSISDITYAVLSKEDEIKRLIQKTVDKNSPGYYASSTYSGYRRFPCKNLIDKELS